MTDFNKAGINTGSATVLALAAFAGNSILCRLALGEAAIDPASYTAIRLIAGALVLRWIARSMADGGSRAAAGSWVGGALLFLYAVSFSFAYVSLSAGTGALILFAAVQFTMIAAGLRSGEKPTRLEWCGSSVAMAGFIYLLLPGLTAPSRTGSLLMIGAGIAWGFYSLLGRGASDPIRTTTENFSRAVPFVSLVALLQWASLRATPIGLLWAGFSGAITSGLGYVAWYAALTRLAATRAATVQLAVPVIAALGGVVFLAEELTGRLLIASVVIPGGIGLSVLAHGRRPPSLPEPRGPNGWRRRFTNELNERKESIS